MMAPTWDGLATGHDRSMRQWAVCTWSGLLIRAPHGRRGPLLLDVDGLSHLWVDRHRGLLSLGAQPFNPDLSVRFSTS